MNKKIESPQNSTIKHLFQLKEKSRTRKREGQFLIEGIQEIQLAIQGGFKISDIYICTKILSIVEFKDQFNGSYSLIEISDEVFHKLAYRETSGGILALAVSKNHHIDKYELDNPNPLLLIAEAPEKPGNIGALLRTADAAGVDGVIIANPKTDLYNPNIIRSSVGCLFTSNIALGSTEEIINFLKKKNINTYAAILQKAIDYTKPKYNKPTAIVVGTEHEGLSIEWRDFATNNIKIPMNGKVDSMNVSVAAGILIFEAVRQRNS